MTTTDIPALIARLRNESGVATGDINARVALMDKAISVSAAYAHRMTS